MEDSSLPAVEHLRLVRRITSWGWTRRWQAATLMLMSLAAYGWSHGVTVHVIGHGIWYGGDARSPYRPVLMVQCHSPFSTGGSIEHSLRAPDSMLTLTLTWDVRAMRFFGEAATISLVTPGRALFSGEEEDLVGVPPDSG